MGGVELGWFVLSCSGFGRVVSWWVDGRGGMSFYVTMWVLVMGCVVCGCVLFVVSLGVRF